MDIVIDWFNHTDKIMNKEFIAQFVTRLIEEKKYTMEYIYCTVISKGMSVTEGGLIQERDISREETIKDWYHKENYHMVTLEKVIAISDTTKTIQRKARAWDLLDVPLVLGDTSLHSQVEKDLTWTPEMDPVYMLTARYAINDGLPEYTVATHMSRISVARRFRHKSIIWDELVSQLTENHLIFMEDEKNVSVGIYTLYLFNALTAV